MGAVHRDSSLPFCDIQERSVKRQTLSWNDFSSAGFSRSDGPLSATLQFSAPITKSVSAWPIQNAEMSKKLKKTQNSLPAFGWDTEPVVGSEEVIEEAFVDVFCDLVYGGGWMDLERYEELDRDCNWALVSSALSGVTFSMLILLPTGRIQITSAIPIHRQRGIRSSDGHHLDII